MLSQIRTPKSCNSYILLSQAKLAPTGIVKESAVPSSLRLVPCAFHQSAILNLQSKISSASSSIRNALDLFNVGPNSRYNSVGNCVLVGTTC